MRILIQRISEGWVEIGNLATPHAGRGLLALIGFRIGDTERLLEPMIKKLINLRILADDQGRMNLSLADKPGRLVLVSQFTLYADCRQGRRPSFIEAMAPEPARSMYDRFVSSCRTLCEPLGIDVLTGAFGAMMQVHLVNDGPVTILLDSGELGMEAGVVNASGQPS